jgi:hypothetical protein
MPSSALATHPYRPSPAPCPVCARVCHPGLHAEILAAATRIAAPGGGLADRLPDWAVVTARIALGDLPLRLSA